MKRILLLLSVLVIAGCVNEKDDMERLSGKFAFTAGFSSESDVQTKVFLDHNYYYNVLYVLWENGDEVSVFDGQNNARFVSDRTGLSTDLVKADGEFDEQASNYYALYPYDENAVFMQDNGQQYVITTHHSVQNARRDAFSFHRAISDCSQSDKNFVFRNVTAVFKANITTEGVERIVFKGNNGEHVAGSIKISYDDASYEIVGEGSDTVTVLPQEGDQTFTPGVYYFTVLPQSFSKGFTITIHMGDATKIVRTVSESVTVPRSSLSIGRAIGTDGSGKEDDPYLIKNKYDFEGIATIVADDEIPCGTTTYIRFENDIDLSSIESWRPINNIRHESRISKLYIEGNNKTISNFAPNDFASGQVIVGEGEVQDDSGHDQPSIFGIVRGTVKDLTILDANIDRVTSVSAVGILAGWIGFSGLETTTVQNVHVVGSVTGKKAVGGLAGMARNAIIEGCSANVTVTASGEHASGLIARYYENVTVKDCHSSGTITGTRGIGGILGFNEKKSAATIDVSQCSSTCTIFGTYQIGGLVGHTQSPILIDSSWVKCNITATSKKKNGVVNTGKQVGGILGVSANSVRVDLAQNYYKGKISADGSFIGGIMGYGTGVTSISDCHSHCSIKNTGDYMSKTNYDMIGVGGVLGGCSGSSVTINNCFVDEGSLVSKAHGTLTQETLPSTWEKWANAVKNPDREDYFLGGGVGGILGYSGSSSTDVNKNICWLDSLICDRTNRFDASCGPIVGCLPQHNTASVANNRYYNSPDGNTTLLFQDTCNGYVPKTLSNVDNETAVVSSLALGDGEEALMNQYCVYNKKTSNAGVDGQKNAPSSVAKNSSWDWDSEIWNCDKYKPFLIVHAAVYEAQ